MNRRRHEVMAERKHLDKRRHPCRVPKVVGIRPTCEAGCGRRFNGNDTSALVVDNILANERECEAGKVAAAADTADQHIRPISISDLKLFDGLLTNHSLM